MRYSVIFICCILFPILASGQNGRQKPPAWVNGTFTERPNSYLEVAAATGYSEDDARGKAVKLLIERRSIATGHRASVKLHNDNIIVSGADELTVQSRIIDTYTERIRAGEYRVSLLAQTSKFPWDTNNHPLEPVSVTNRYKFSPRVFVPGMAQIYKGQTTRGALFITGEVVAIGGIIAFEGARSSYQSKINRTHNVNEIQSYVNKADNMRNIRNGFIVGAAAIYAWNIIDGIVAKGKKHVVFGNADIALAPYTDPMSSSSGLFVAVTF